MCLVYGYPWDLSPCFCNLNVSLSLTPRVLLEYASCRASAHLPWHLFPVSFLLWPCCSGSFPRSLMPGLSWRVFLVSPSHPHLPCHLQADLAKGVSVPTLPVQSVPAIVAWRGSAGRWGLRCPLSAALPLQLPGCILAPGSHLQILGQGLQLSPASMPKIDFFFLVNRENIFQNSSSALFLFLILQGKRNHFFFIDAHMLLCIFVITPQQFISFIYLPDCGSEIWTALQSLKFSQHLIFLGMAVWKSPNVSVHHTLSCGWWPIESSSYTEDVMVDKTDAPCSLFRTTPFFFPREEGLTCTLPHRLPGNSFFICRNKCKKQGAISS